MYPGDGEVAHFSQDPTIAVFEPRPVAGRNASVVWAVDRRRAPDYWFPRECPRVLAWVEPTTVEADRRLIGQFRRAHVIEPGWLDAMRTTALYAYRFDAAPFVTFGEHGHAMVATERVVALGPPSRLGDLVELHESAGIELRVATDLLAIAELWQRSTLGFSAIRLRNACGFGA